MIILPAVAVAAAIFLIWWNYVVYSQRRKLQWMPGELGLPVLGKILEVKDNKSKLDQNHLVTFYYSSSNNTKLIF